MTQLELISFVALSETLDAKAEGAVDYAESSDDEVTHDYQRGRGDAYGDAAARLRDLIKKLTE